LVIGALALVAAVASGTAFATIYYLHHHGSYYFTDIAPTDSAGHHVGYAVEAGTTAGCGPQRFCPGDYVTRRQMVVFLQRQAVNEFMINYLLFDWIFHDGRYFGETALHTGRITQAQFDEYLEHYQWAIGRLEALLPPAAPSAQAGRMLEALRQAEEAR
jgi:hypothetical protein